MHAKNFVWRDSAKWSVDVPFFYIDSYLKHSNTRIRAFEFKFKKHSILLNDLFKIFVRGRLWLKNFVNVVDHVAAGLLQKNVYQL